MSIRGSVPSYSLHGEPVAGQRPAGNVPGSKLAPASAPFVGRGNKCSANEDKCEGNRVKGEVLCAGHLRSARKAARLAEAGE